jgi:hypothetical protein
MSSDPDTLTRSEQQSVNERVWVLQRQVDPHQQQFRARLHDDSSDGATASERLVSMDFSSARRNLRLA